MFFVYILKSKKDDNLYVGYTNDLRRRIEEHNLGFNQSTRLRKPFKLIYYEAYFSKERC
jgi:putative endonuclease